jgi:[protein-PII] uridylyltransferase
MISEAQRRSKKESILKKDSLFRELKKSQKKKILGIESNLLFFKYEPSKIINISSWITSLDDQYDYVITNSKVLTIEIVRKQSLNLGYLLGRLNNLNIATMDIFKFFNKTKYFRVEFLESVEEFDIPMIEEIIKDSFDMSKRTKHKVLSIKRDEIKINCNHSKTYAMMSVNAKDQPALLSNIMSIFDDIGIDIASAKIQTIKNRARNLILIEKNGKFCVNKDKVINKLVKGV